MISGEEMAAEALEEFLDGALQGRRSALPHELDKADVARAAILVEAARLAQPDASFAGRLEAKLMSASRPPQTQPVGRVRYLLARLAGRMIGGRSPLPLTQAAMVLAVLALALIGTTAAFPSARALAQDSFDRLLAQFGFVRGAYPPPASSAGTTIPAAAPSPEPTLAPATPAPPATLY